MATATDTKVRLIVQNLQYTSAKIRNVTSDNFVCVDWRPAYIAYFVMSQRKSLLYFKYSEGYTVYVMKHLKKQRRNDMKQDKRN